MNYQYSVQKYKNGDIVKNWYKESGGVFKNFGSFFGRNWSIQSPRWIFSVTKHRTNDFIFFFITWDIWNFIFYLDVILNFREKTLKVKSIKNPSCAGSSCCVGYLRFIVNLNKDVEIKKNIFWDYFMTMNQNNILPVKDFIARFIRNNALYYTEYINTVQKRLITLEQSNYEIEQRWNYYEKTLKNINHRTNGKGRTKDIVLNAKDFIIAQYRLIHAKLTEIINSLQFDICCTFNWSTNTFLYCVEMNSMRLVKRCHGWQCEINWDMMNFYLKAIVNNEAYELRKRDDEWILISRGNVYNITPRYFVDNEKWLVYCDKKNVCYIGEGRLRRGGISYHGWGWQVKDGVVERGEFVDGVWCSRDNNSSTSNNNNKNSKEIANDNNNSNTSWMSDNTDKLSDPSDLNLEISPDAFNNTII